LPEEPSKRTQMHRLRNGQDRGRLTSKKRPGKTTDNAKVLQEGYRNYLARETAVQTERRGGGLIGGCRRKKKGTTG